MYNGGMEWGVELTEQAEGWFFSLTQNEQDAIAAAIDRLVDCGPRLDARPSTPSRAAATRT